MVGGADGQMLSPPLTPGVEVVSYSELLKKVISDSFLTKFT